MLPPSRVVIHEFLDKSHSWTRGNHDFPVLLDALVQDQNLIGRLETIGSLRY